MGGCITHLKLGAGYEEIVNVVGEGLCIYVAPLHHDGLNSHQAPLTHHQNKLQEWLTKLLVSNTIHIPLHTTPRGHMIH